ncbi:MAG: hypothetical protein A3K53_07140 [Deltaproteobacteria bacterium RIFOXYB2_FULL_66_7]|nr:MAG: hypothetical protein A3K53_07140 [Deltaproteobacteria bacterium RIFOXYB2_FULL_66_7]
MLCTIALTGCVLRTQQDKHSEPEIIIWEAGPFRDFHYYKEVLTRIESDALTTESSAEVVYVAQGIHEVVAFRNGLSVMDAIEDSGGYDAKRPVAVEILRRGTRHSYQIRLPLYSNKGRSFVLQENDIVVPLWMERWSPDSSHLRDTHQTEEAQLVYYYGSGNSPERFPYSPGMTLQDLVQEPTGFLIRITRHMDGRESVIHLDWQSLLDWWRWFPLQPGDEVSIGEESR